MHKIIYAVAAVSATFAITIAAAFGISATSEDLYFDSVSSTVSVSNDYACEATVGVSYPSNPTLTSTTVDVRLTLSGDAAGCTGDDVFVKLYDGASLLDTGSDLVPTYNAGTAIVNFTGLSVDFSSQKITSVEVVIVDPQP